MFVGRTVTISRNGIMTVDHKEIEGITGGALDANEGEPGPFYIQGDHTGGLKFRNITVSVPKNGADAGRITLSSTTPSPSRPGSE